MGEFKIRMLCIEFVSLNMNKKKIQLFILRVGNSVCVGFVFVEYIFGFHLHFAVWWTPNAGIVSQAWTFKRKKKTNKNAILHFALFPKSRWRFPPPCHIVWIIRLDFRWNVQSNGKFMQMHLNVKLKTKTTTRFLNNFCLTNNVFYLHIRHFEYFEAFF